MSYSVRYRQSEIRDEIDALRNAAPNPWLAKLAEVMHRLHVETLVLRRKVVEMEIEKEKREKIAA